jgi:hypothetical protein
MGHASNVHLPPESGKYEVRFRDSGTWYVRWWNAEEQRWLLDAGGSHAAYEPRIVVAWREASA